VCVCVWRIERRNYIRTSFVFAGLVFGNFWWLWKGSSGKFRTWKSERIPDRASVETLHKPSGTEVCVIERTGSQRLTHTLFYGSEAVNVCQERESCNCTLPLKRERKRQRDHVYRSPYIKYAHNSYFIVKILFIVVLMFKNVIYGMNSRLKHWENGKKR